MKVLAGVDGAPRSYHALAFGSQLLSPEVDDIVLYFSPPKLILSDTSDVAEDLPEMARDALAQSVFQKAQEHLPTAFRPSVSTMVGQSEAWEGILAAADQTEADLILIGAHSATRRLALFVGGSARKIVHRSEQPVLLVRERQPTSSDGINVLIACDEGDGWRDAVPVLQEFSWPEGTVATLFHVVEMMDEEQMNWLAEGVLSPAPNSMSLIERHRSSVAERSAARLDRLGLSREALPSIVKNATPKVAQGHVVESIVNEVRENNVDLVVVTARRLGPIGRWIGSTTEGLLAQCPCSLLIVHQHTNP